MAESSASTQYPWYAVVQGAGLQQGDILAGCPVLRPLLTDTQASTAADVAVNRRTGIILTQSCDLVLRADGRSHCKEVLFCAVHSRAELANDPFFGGRAAWEQARKGRLPGYHVLNQCELPGSEREFLLVDFSRVFTVDIAVVRDLAASQSQRLRLLPPYREHLSQAFARFFMRVGLPVDVPPFR